MMTITPVIMLLMWDSVFSRLELERLSSWPRRSKQPHRQLWRARLGRSFWLYFFLFYPSTGFLSLGAADTAGWRTCVGSCPVHCRSFSSISGFYNLSTIIIHHSPTPSQLQHPKCFQTLPNTPWGVKRLFENYYSRIRAAVALSSVWPKGNLLKRER